MKNQKLQLVIGDKNLSTWSMRPWLVLKESKLPFEEILIYLDRPDTNEKLLKYSPSKKVPCLIQGDLQIWDSLAICEYIAELAPSKNLWPTDSFKRALARSYVAEMHSGFSSMRNQLSMDIRLRMEILHLVPDTVEEIRRIIFLWESAIKMNNGPFLFGAFGIVDAFYAPVVMRFLSYGIKIESEIIEKYMKAIENHDSVQEWVSAAKLEKNYKENF